MAYTLLTSVAGNLLQSQLSSEYNYLLIVLEFMAIISTKGALRLPTTNNDYHPIHPSVKLIWVVLQMTSKQWPPMTDWLTSPSQYDPELRKGANSYDISRTPKVPSRVCYQKIESYDNIQRKWKWSNIFHHTIPAWRLWKYSLLSSHSYYPHVHIYALVSWCDIFQICHHWYLLISNAEQVILLTVLYEYSSTIFLSLFWLYAVISNPVSCYFFSPNFRPKPDPESKSPTRHNLKTR